jgi:hypothetical protein
MAASDPGVVEALRNYNTAIAIAAKKIALFMHNGDNDKNKYTEYYEMIKKKYDEGSIPDVWNQNPGVKMPDFAEVSVPQAGGGLLLQGGYADINNTGTIISDVPAPQSYADNPYVNTLINTGPAMYASTSGNPAAELGGNVYTYVDRQLYGGKKKSSKKSKKEW